MILSPSDNEWIESRWQQWEPLVRLADLRAGGTQSLRVVHTHRIYNALAANLPRGTIARYSLDDPRPSDTDFGQILAVATERRRARMGRVKGRRKRNL